MKIMCKKTGRWHEEINTRFDVINKNEITA